MIAVADDQRCDLRQREPRSPAYPARLSSIDVPA
jgi:hypothetical protein